MSNIINLNKARKKKNRHDAAIKAGENRVKFGRTKSQKQADNTKIGELTKKIDGHKIDDEEE